MSRISAVQSVNSMLEAKKSAIGSPKAMFRDILEEKLGVDAATSGGTINGSAYADLMLNGGTSALLDGTGMSGWEQLVHGNTYADYIASKVIKDGESGSTAYDAYIKEASQTYDVPEELIKAVIYCESSFNPNAVSKSGAVGLMQLMPATAKGLGVENSYDPRQNIMGGTKYLSSLIKNFDGDLILAMAGYNMGGTRVKNLGITPNSASESAYSSIPSGVMSYAKKVISKMAEYGGSV